MSANLYEVIRAPRVSEKTARLQEVSNQYVFEVAKTATKADVKAAVEKIFDVKVEAVNVVNVKGKTKSFKFRQGRITVVESFDVDAPKTKGLVARLADLKAGKRPLIVTEEASDNLYLSARNLPYVQVRDVQGLDPVALVGADTVVVTTNAVKKIEEWLA